MSWTDERVELLRKLWLDGKSASQIAAELANGITRNAVIGKVHRLGLSTRIKTQASTTPRQRPRPLNSRPSARPISAPIRGANALALHIEPMDLSLPETTESVVVPLAENVTIMELREAMCRWPIGDPSHSDFRFCGSKSPAGASYCAHHSRIAYQPPQDRRRERDREKRLQRSL